MLLSYIQIKVSKIPVVRILLVTQHLEIERDAVSCLYECCHFHFLYLTASRYLYSCTAWTGKGRAAQGRNIRNARDAWNGWITLGSSKVLPLSLGLYG
jgi:hypothetical protein